MMKLALLLIAASYVLAAGDKSYFAPYGSGVGDTFVSACDDCSSSVTAFDFIFYGTSYSSLYVNNNGLITFTTPTGQYTPVGMSGAYYPSIAPYWGDVDTRTCGTVSYRATTDAALLSTWSARIPGGHFTGVRAFVATWSDVGYYYVHCDKLNSFQAILITNVTHSWVFLNYGDLPWTTGDASGGQNGLGGTPASVGFAAGYGGTFVQTDESLRPTVVGTTNFVTLVSATIIDLPPTSGAVCGNGDVESGEECDGGACCTSTCTFADEETVCRASAGGCDPAEYCTGASTSCPADQIDARGTICRPAADACDIAETCDGSVSCPADALSQTTSCFCARQNLQNGEMGYFCNANGGFYQCLGGVFAPQSRDMPCAAGTSCGCAFGAECSCNLLKSPCVWANTLQEC